MTGRRPGRPRGAGVFDDDHLLDLALDALATGGYRSLSMRGLARQLGVSLASVQHRFTTKDELWRAAIDHAVDKENHDPAGTPLNELLRRQLSWSKTHPGLLQAILTDDAPGHEERHAYVAGKIRPAVDTARAVFPEFRRLGLARDIDLAVLAAVMLTGAGILATLPPAIAEVIGLDTESTDRLADGLADLLMFGVISRGDA
ncbi:MAG: TetR/AcrR family transcriptional regulator [Actinomycetota bacterium]